MLKKKKNLKKFKKKLKKKKINVCWLEHGRRIATGRHGVDLPGHVEYDGFESGRAEYEVPQFSLRVRPLSAQRGTDGE